jgi:4-hydroxyphenylpyruvate dioxygenase
MENANTTIETDFFNIEYDYIEYFVGMAKMVVYWHVMALGFKVIAYSGPETGNEESFSYLIKKNNIKLVITSASQPSSYKIVSFVDLHGNGIKRVAIKVNDVADNFDFAIKNGAIPLNYPKSYSDQNGSIMTASFKVFDDNEIVLINYGNYRGDFMPGYKNVEKDWMQPDKDTFLDKIDHLACALRLNEIKLWENYINNIFQSKTVKEFDERQTSTTKKIGILLKVLQSKDKQLNHVLVESDNKNKSQVQLFIDENYGSGIQHVAFSTSNIFRTVELLKLNGVKFTKHPDSYFDQLQLKHPHLDVQSLRKHGVLCDVVDGAYLFQVFTAPIGDRSTFFYEIVQRVNNYDGFGLDNIEALFKAMELELNIRSNISLAN